MTARLFTLRGALRELDLDNRRCDVDRLRDALRARERRTGRKVMVRTPGRDRPKLRVTLDVVRRECAGMLEVQTNRLPNQFAEHLRAIHEAIGTGVAEHVEEHVQPQIDDLRADLIELLSQLESLLPLQNVFRTTGRRDKRSGVHPGLRRVIDSPSSE